MKPSSTVDSVSFRFCAMVGNSCPVTWTKGVAERSGNTERHRAKSLTTCWLHGAFLDHVYNRNHDVYGRFVQRGRCVTDRTIPKFGSTGGGISIASSASEAGVSAVCCATFCELAHRCSFKSRLSVVCNSNFALCSEGRTVFYA